MKTTLSISMAVLMIPALTAPGRAVDKGQERGAAHLEAAFKKIDADGNGAVSLEEFIKARNPANDEAKQKLETRFKKMDADGNGQLTLEEFKKAMEAHLSKRNSDGNNRLVAGRQHRNSRRGHHRHAHKRQR